MRFGSASVLAIYPGLREVHVYDHGASIQALRVDDAITLPELLPGWSCQVSELLP